MKVRILKSKHSTVHEHDIGELEGEGITFEGKVNFITGKKTTFTAHVSQFEFEVIEQPKDELP